MRKLWEMIQKNTDKWAAFLWLAVFAGSLIPLLYLARYAVPGCDDYTYGIRTHGAWLETGSLAAVLRAALSTTVEYWHTWQGTYASIFLMTLSPGLLDEKWYFLTTFLMTGMICLSIWSLLHTVLIRYVCPAAPRGQKAIGILVVLFLCLQTMVAPSDGLYWYNGALHYVFMESVLFFQAALLLTICRTQKGSLKAAGMLLSGLLAFVLGGANLLTGLQSCILTAFLALLLFRQAVRSAVDSVRSRLWILFPLTVNLAGFALNVLAPGNSVRETTAAGMGAVSAILLSFYWAAVFITEWMEPLAIVCFFLLLPVLWKLTRESRAKFFFPPAAAAVSYCVFAAMFTPTLYATSSEGPDRCKNIMRIVLYLLVFLNLLNDLGWLGAHRREHLICRILRLAEERYAAWLLCASLAAGLIFVLPADKNSFTSVSALRSLVNGEAAQYYAENEARIALYRDESLPDVTISYLTAKPYLLFKEDVGNEGSSDYWLNLSVVGYYRKNSVTVVEAQK